MIKLCPHLHSVQYELLRHLATELVERATDGNTVDTTAHLENSEQRLEHTTETLSSEKTSRE